MLRRTLQTYPDSLLAQMTRDDVMMDDQQPHAATPASAPKRVIKIDRDPDLFALVTEVRFAAEGGRVRSEDASGCVARVALECIVLLCTGGNVGGERR